MNTKGPAQGEHEKNVMVHRKGQSLLDSAGCAPAQRRFRYRSVALIWSAIMMLLMILFIGLSIDTAQVALVFHQMQNAADAAALAGTRIVKIDPNSARVLAQRFARQNIETQQSLPEGTVPLLDLNMDNDPNGDIVIGRYDRLNQVFTPVMPGTGSINAMAVMIIRSQARMELGGAFP